MPNIKNNSASQETRRKLLHAAGKIFAAKGVHATTIKDITGEAGVNNAAINYHFRDKFELYEEVIADMFNETLKLLISAPLPDGTSEEQLRAFVETQLKILLRPERPVWESGLVSWEMTHPTSRMAGEIRSAIYQNTQRLKNILGEILEVDPSDNAVEYAVCSIMGQCLFYVDHRDAASQMFPKIDMENISLLAEHISNFSLRGLKRVNKRREVKATR